jgi:hypothetical protein
MLGALIRTGSVLEFKALGVEGQPVFSAAHQLREAIRIKIGRPEASCLAVPQPNELKDNFDWYAPFQGDVVPWSLATQDERSKAYKQLDKLHQKLLATSKSMRDETTDREKQIFGRLLEKCVNFPDESHVFLVDGKPVVTFWGFTDHPGTYVHDPLACLRPSTAMQTVPKNELLPPALTAEEPVHVAPVIEAKSKFTDRRWLWWLLLPLLLLLLFYFLRACAPSVQTQGSVPELHQPSSPDLLAPETDTSPDDLVVYHSSQIGATDIIIDTGKAGPLVTEDRLAGGLTSASGATSETLSTTDLTPPPDKSDPSSEASSARELGEGGGPEDTRPITPVSDEPMSDVEPRADDQPNSSQSANEQASPNQNRPIPPELNQESTSENQQLSGQVTPVDSMQIPREAQQSGSTDFLNGKWKADAGIQDTKTGKPMQLEYVFEHGQGQVKARRGDGIECVGGVNAAMDNGNLAITSEGQADCNDGSSYKLPEVICAPGEQRAANCEGSYENLQFPITIKRGEK